jgi:hypothetical protein
MDLTKADAAAEGVHVPSGQADAPVFDAAFPMASMLDLPCLPEARRG